MKTFVAKKGTVPQKWVLMDAEGQVLGRMASRIAMILQGKHRPTYTPHVDTGDFVVVVNAEKVKLTGSKRQKKTYFSHSTYLGSLKETSVQELLQRKPTEVVRRAVRRMLPKTTLGTHMFGKLKVYAGPNHPHAAQLPEKLSL
ncbi:MAG: 50S ribosomal protein L13 [Planctomycetota bacterium]